MLKRISCYLSVLLLSSCQLFGQEATVEGRLDVASAEPGDVVVWLIPKSDIFKSTVIPTNNKVYSLVQQGHQFSPHLLVIPVGTRVEFPNRDLVFHNVFSLFEGRRFDLGLYEAGASKGVSFDRPGVSYIFCNIHKNMSAVVIALDTNYYGIRQKDGFIRINHVPYGRYTLHIWAEGSDPATLAGFERDIRIDSASHTIGRINLSAVRLALRTHKNKYGVDYRPAIPDNPAYPE